MGTLINFFNQHIVTPSKEREEYFTHTPRPTTQPKIQKHPSDKPRTPFSFINHPSTMEQQQQRESALNQFPYEEKHSFNPHYQHNLSSSPSFSVPPSLSSSPSNSSPSSAYSTCSNSSFSRASGARLFNQDSHMHQYNYNYSYNSSNSNLTNSINNRSNSISSNSSGCGGSNKHEYSYHRQFNRRQSLRCSTNQQHQQEPMVGEWMFGIAEDDDYCAASTMTRANPQETPISPSSSSSTVSLKSSLSNKGKSQRASIFGTFGPSSRSTVSFSPVVQEHTLSESSVPSSSLGLLPCANTRSMSLASDSTATITIGVVDVPSSSQQQQEPCNTNRISAKQSLLRIAHCQSSEDGWCTQKAGQYIQRYGAPSTRAIRVDGRRGRRL